MRACFREAHLKMSLITLDTGGFWRISTKLLLKETEQATAIAHNHRYAIIPHKNDTI